ncbi:MAG TPA: hypothetical protein VN711_00980 [Candidatus Saccharimonadales bacterium]|nr:hypothetical protein [Candidatus Saccharimonadales bacterium]
MVDASEWDRYPSGIGGDLEKIKEDAARKALPAIKAFGLPPTDLRIKARRFGKLIFWRIEPKDRR